MNKIFFVLIALLMPFGASADEFGARFSNDAPAALAPSPETIEPAAGDNSGDNSQETAPAEMPEEAQKDAAKEGPAEKQAPEKPAPEDGCSTENMDLTI